MLYEKNEDWWTIPFAQHLESLLTLHNNPQLHSKISDTSNLLSEMSSNERENVFLWGAGIFYEGDCEGHVLDTRLAGVL